jgi:membrane-bound lytic murein transglycosylase D
MEINARVVRWMRRFQTDQRASFESFLARGTAYSGIIRTKLAARGMPEDLLYLAMIESGFETGATSPVSAVGMWQFTGPTARQYGLRVDPWVDERRDPMTATDAALDYLEWLHERYRSWYLAAAAYNAGYGTVDEALRRHADGRRGEESLYWDIIDHLPRETRDYVPKLLAATMLAGLAEAYGFEVEPEGPYRFDRVWVPGGTPLSAVARLLDVPADEIADLNPHLLRGAVPPGDAFALRVPVGTASQVVASLGGRPSSSID